MIRVTPLRLTTRQCSQIGFTLLRTFTGALHQTKIISAKTLRLTGLARLCKGGWYPFCIGARYDATPADKLPATDQRSTSELHGDSLELGQHLVHRRRRVRRGGHRPTEHDITGTRGGCLRR